MAIERKRISVIQSVVGNETTPQGLHGQEITLGNALAISRKKASGQAVVAPNERGVLAVRAEVQNRQGTGKVYTGDSPGKRLRRVYNEMRTSTPTTNDPGQYAKERRQVLTNRTLLGAALTAQRIKEDKRRENLLAETDHKERQEAHATLRRLRMEQEQEAEEKNRLSGAAKAVLLGHPKAGFGEIKPDYKNHVLEVSDPTRGISSSQVPFEALVRGEVIVEKVPTTLTPFQTGEKGEEGPGIIRLKHTATNEPIAVSYAEQAGRVVSNLGRAVRSLIVLRRPEIDPVDEPSYADLLPTDGLVKASEAYERITTAKRKRLKLTGDK
jgi:hypothetical protein